MKQPFKTVYGRRIGCNLEYGNIQSFILNWNSFPEKKSGWWLIMYKPGNTVFVHRFVPID